MKTARTRVLTIIARSLRYSHCGISFVLARYIQKKRTYSFHRDLNLRSHRIVICSYLIVTACSNRKIGFHFFESML